MKFRRLSACCLLGLFGLHLQADLPLPAHPPEVTEELWRSGDTLSLEVEARRDVFLFGNHVEIDGRYHADLWAGGRRVTFRGVGADDVRLFSSEFLTFDGIIQPTGSLRGISLGNLLVNTNAVIRGPARLTTARNLTLNGSFDGPLTLSAGRLVFSARVNGDVHLTSSDVVIMPGSRITGNLIVHNPEPLSVPEALVGGEIFHQPLDPDTIGIPASWIWWFRIFQIINGFILGLLMVRFLPRFAGNSVEILLQFQPQTLLLGLLTALFLGLAGFALLASRMAAGAGILLLGALTFLGLAGHLLVALALGALLVRHRQPLTFFRLALGLLAGLFLLQGLFALPWIGGSLWFITAATGLGAAINTIRNTQNPLKLDIPAERPHIPRT